ncbi:MAG TPA: RDD family protein [Arenimonas sp.]|uniref:RDD family protein n=1 Tax=Arenimonas sp. TaxID=1872635 RepID=UPI002CBA811C|nr:RDD family protein [Arenimonas sp.]HMB56285.1 RDD family protein [Arenimonas sp.]
MPTAAPPLDTLREVETPEGVALTLRAAGPVPRALAWLIDFTLRLGIVWVVAMITTLLGHAGNGVMAVIVFLVYWGYPIALEVLFNGQTLGKRVMGLRVIRDNGAPIGWIPSIVRNLMRSVDMFPAMYGFGLASCLIDRHARRLGDIVAGTLVVHVDPPERVLYAPEVPPLPLPVLLLREEQSALVAFAERAPLITRERQEELANLLAPLTGAAGSLGVQRLFGYANGLLGRR